jgi:cytochrome oxidase assembly protein ShyY1
MRIKPVPVIICLALAALGVVLGLWQLSRADGKRALQSLQAARQTQSALPTLERNADRAALEWRRAHLRGQFLPAWTVYLDNRQQQGVPGVWVMTPFKLADNGLVVLVARGWLARNKQDRASIAAYFTPDGVVELDGVLHGHSPRLLQLGRDAPLRPGALRQNLDLDELAQQSGLPLLPLMLEQSAPASPQDRLGRDWPQAASGIEKHLGYAFQWFALALVAIVFLLITGFRRGNN